MPWYKFPDGTDYHVHFGTAGNKKAAPPCLCKREDQSHCGIPAPFLCDWKVGGGKTCDRPMCDAHAFQVDTDKHLCPQHRELYEAWKKAKEAKPNAAQDLPRV